MVVLVVQMLLRETLTPHEHAGIFLGGTEVKRKKNNNNKKIYNGHIHLLKKSFFSHSPFLSDIQHHINEISKIEVDVDVQIPTG